MPYSNSSPEERSVAIGETASDMEVGLPADDLHLTISRINDGNGYWRTRLWVNRKVRRLYALGLLQEAIAMLLDTNSEVSWASDTPSCMDENGVSEFEDEDDYGDDGDDEYPVLNHPP